MGTILLTGATGNIGSAVAQALQKHGVPFRILLRSPDKAQGIGAEEVAQGDYNDSESLRKAMEGVELVFLVAPAHPDMLTFERNAIDAAKAAGVKFVVMISAMGASPEQPTQLGRNHAAAEAYLEQSGLNYTILRPHSFMQNTLGNIATVREQGAIYSSIGEGKVPLIDARDIGEAAAKLLLKGGYDKQRLDLTGPEALSQHELARITGEAAGKEVAYVPVPREAARKGMIGAGFPEWLADDLLTLTDLWKQGHDTKVTPHLQQVLGHPPRTYADFMKDHGHLFK
jgi:uncharacterized protein YbjT (DUF2867 family)